MVDNTSVKIMNKTDIDIVALAKSHQSKNAFDQASAQIKENTNRPLYESVKNQPSLLRRISPDGTVTTGTFESGIFKEMKSKQD